MMPASIIKPLLQINIDALDMKPRVISDAQRQTKEANERGLPLRCLFKQTPLMLRRENSPQFLPDLRLLGHFTDR